MMRLIENNIAKLDLQTITKDWDKYFRQNCFKRQVIMTLFCKKDYKFWNVSTLFGLKKGWYMAITNLAESGPRTNFNITTASIILPMMH